MPNNPKCKNCKWYDKIDDQKGLCRKLPPILPSSEFPRVKKDDWCSHYEEEPA